MSGLNLKLAPGERFIVNGALLENGNKQSSICVKDGDARVLRCSDALRPESVNTPVKQVYFAIQLMITGDIDDEVALPAIYETCSALEQVFGKIVPGDIDILRSMLERKNYYSALCHTRGLIDTEAMLIARQNDKLSDAGTRKVA